MSSRLQRLGARLLGHAPVLAPRVATRFEPTGGDSIASTITIENTLQPVGMPPAAPRREQPSLVRREGPGIPATPPTTVKTDDDSPASRAAHEAAARTAPAPTPHPRPESKPAEPRRGESDTASAPPIQGSPIVPAEPVSRPATAIDRRKESAVTNRPQETAPQSRNTKSPAVSKSDLASELRRLREWISETAVTPSRVLPPAAQPSISRAPPPSDSVRVSPPSPVPIQIDIGTIIIRATTSESQSSRAPGPVDRSAGLARYLARRSAGRP